MESLKAPAGFTLVEAVLSIALVAAGLMGIFRSYQGVASNSSLSDQTIIATNLARETIEKIAALRDCNENGCGYAEMLTAINTDNSFDDASVSGYTSYSVDATALEVDPDDDNTYDDFMDASPGSGFARITVQVIFNNGANFVKLETLIADYPDV